MCRADILYIALRHCCLHHYTNNWTTDLVVHVTSNLPLMIRPTLHDYAIVTYAITVTDLFFARLLQHIRHLPFSGLLLSENRNLRAQTLHSPSIHFTHSPTMTAWLWGLLSLSKLSQQHQESLHKFGKKLINSRYRNFLPPYPPPPTRATRHYNKLVPIRDPRTDRYKNSIIPTIVKMLNSY